MSAIVSIDNVSFARDGKRIINNLSWHVGPGERWVVLGPNGSGKTTLLELVADWESPASGTIVVLGDNTSLESPEWIRPRIGIASAGMIKRIPVGDTVVNAIVSAAYAIASSQDEEFDSVDIRRGTRVAQEWGLGKHIDERIGTLSEGELKRVQIARSIMTDPELLLLDEPTAGLDLGAREELLMLIGAFAATDSAPTIILVTHHVEEIPRGFTHALILSEGSVIAAGPIGTTVTSDVLTKAYNRPISVTAVNGRLMAQASF